jgi:hypothetical protein
MKLNFGDISWIEVAHGSILYGGCVAWRGYYRFRNHNCDGVSTAQRVSLTPELLYSRSRLRGLFLQSCN